MGDWHAWADGNCSFHFSAWLRMCTLVVPSSRTRLSHLTTLLHPHWRHCSVISVHWPAANVMWNPVAPWAAFMRDVFCFHVQQKTKNKAWSLCQCGYDKWLLTGLIWHRLTSDVSPGGRPGVQVIGLTHISWHRDWVGAIRCHLIVPLPPTAHNTWPAIRQRLNFPKSHLILGHFYSLTDSEISQAIFFPHVSCKHMWIDFFVLFFFLAWFFNARHIHKARPRPLWHISVVNFKFALMVGCMRRFQLSDRLLFALLHLSGFISPTVCLFSPPSFALARFLERNLEVQCS